MRPFSEWYLDYNVSILWSPFEATQESLIFSILRIITKNNDFQQKSATKTNCYLRRNQIITDELRKKETQETMLLHFTAADPGNFLNMDIMSFLVTKAQKLFPEYHCAGVLDA